MEPTYRDKLNAFCDENGFSRPPGELTDWKAYGDVFNQWHLKAYSQIPQPSPSAKDPIHIEPRGPDILKDGFDVYPDTPETRIEALELLGIIGGRSELRHRLPVCMGGEPFRDRTFF